MPEDQLVVMMLMIKLVLLALFRLWQQQGTWLAWRHEGRGLAGGQSGAYPLCQ